MTNPFATLWDYFRPKAEATNGLTLEEVIRRVSRGAVSDAGVSVTVDRAAGLAAMAACERVLCSDVAQLPLVLFRREKENRQQARDRKLFTVLHDRANDWQTSFQFRKIMHRDLFYRGRAYARIVRSGRDVIELIRLHPDTMKAMQDTVTLRVTYEHTLADGRTHVFAKRDILHLWMNSDDGLDGISPIQAYRESIGDSLAIRQHGSGYFKSKARLGGLLELAPGTMMGPEAITALLKDFDDLYAGGENAHKTGMLPQGVKFTAMTANMEDSQWIESRKLTGRDIFGIFGVPPHKGGDLERATFCLPGQTEVYTDEGPRQIVDVREDDRVWSLSESGAWILSRVVRTQQTGHDEILTIRTTNRILTCNARHRVLVRRKVAAPVGGKGGYHAVAWTTDWEEAGNLCVGDTVLTVGQLPNDGLVTCPTRQVSIGFAEFCGLLIGDGNVSMVGGDPVGVQIARHERAPYMDHYRQVMQEEFARSASGGRGYAQTRRQVPIRLQEGERQTRFRSVRAGQELALLGLSGTAHTKRVPGWVFQLDAVRRLAVLRGFLDADGSVDKLGRASFSSCNRTMLSQMRHLCMGLGIPVTNLRCQTGQTKLPNGRIAEFRQWSFVCSDPAHNLRIGSHTPEYIRRMRDGKPFASTERSYGAHGGRGFAAGPCRLSRINRIERSVIAEPVFDLEVETTHSFIADGVVVHNSNVESENISYIINGLMPHLVCWEQAIQRDLLDSDPAYFAKFNVSGLLRGDAKSRNESLQIQRRNGIINANEWRELEDRNPRDDEGGDEYIVEQNMRVQDGTEPVEPEPSGNGGPPAQQDMEAVLAAIAASER